MDNTVVTSGANPTVTTSTANPAPHADPVGEAARVASEKAEADRIAAESERKKLGDADHAAKVIARANEEAKRHRERAEKAEADATAALAKLKEREEKDLAEQSKFKELAERREKELTEERSARQKEREQLKAERERERAEEQAGRVLDAVTLAAVKSGILDEDDVSLAGFREAIALAKVENGRIVGVTAAIARMKELKPHKFKVEPVPETEEQKTEREEREATAARTAREQRIRDESGRFTPPDPASNATNFKNVDAAKANDSEFDAITARLRAQRV